MVRIVEMGGTCMCCGNVGYVSVAEMGVCVVEMWGVYQLQKWGYVLWKCGVCISCRNGGTIVCIAEMGGMCCGNVGVCIIFFASLWFYMNMIKLTGPVRWDCVVDTPPINP